MKPNRKDAAAPVSTKKTSTIGTITAGNVAVVAPKHDEPLRNLRENVTFIGWMGIIASATLLLCSGLTMQWQNDLVRYMMLVLRKSGETERSRAMLRRVVFYKITYEVFTLCKTIRQNSLKKVPSAPNEDGNKNNYLVLQSEA